MTIDTATVRAIIDELHGKGYRDPFGRNATVHLAIKYMGAIEGDEVASDLDDLEDFGDL